MNTDLTVSECLPLLRAFAGILDKGNFSRREGTLVWTYPSSKGDKQNVSTRQCCSEAVRTLWRWISPPRRIPHICCIHEVTLLPAPFLASARAHRSEICILIARASFSCLLVSFRITVLWCSSMFGGLRTLLGARNPHVSHCSVIVPKSRRGMEVWN
jgi:hypothetical protein